MSKIPQENLHDPSSKTVFYLAPQMPIEDDEINLIDYWRILMRYKWIIVVITLLTGGITLALASKMAPVYHSEVTLSPVGEEKAGGLAALAGQFGGLASMAGVNLGSSGGKTEETIATLESRAFTNEFIKDEKLLEILFNKNWNSESKTWIVEKEEDIPSDWDAYELFNSIRTITSDKKSGMYILAIEWTDPNLAAEWANKLVKRINAHQKKAAIEEAQNSIEYLQNQVNETSIVEMRQAIFRLIEAQTKNIMLANVRDEFVFKVIDPAVVPEKPIKPKKRLMAVLGVIVGFMLGVFIAFFIAFIQKQKALATTIASHEEIP